MDPQRTPGSHDQLMATLGVVRSRWKRALALRGLAVFAGVLLVLIALSAAGFGRWGLNAATITGFRIAFALAALAAFGWAVLLPLLRRVSDERVALYIEEHEPALESALISAVELHGGDADRDGIARALIASVAAKCRTIDHGRRIDARRLRRNAYAAGTAAIIVSAIVAFGPQPLRVASRALMFPAPAAEAAAVLRIAVQPGNDTIARGADVTVSARLHAFSSSAAELVLREAGTGAWRRQPMADAGRKDGFEAVLFDVAAATDYYIEAGGVRSATYRIEVAEAPYVRALTLEYTFPDYTGRQLERVEPAGDIVVPKGTLVRVVATPSSPAATARIKLNDAQAVRMEKGADGSLSGTMRVLSDGLYHIELPGLDGSYASASPQYSITAIPDEPPRVSFDKPGRDVKATAVDEIFASVQAQDDYGVARLEIAFSVNGGPQQTRVLSSSVAREVSGAHTFYLEELSLEPGDFISYFARATDNNGVDGARSSTTDIYFVEIRPFGRDYRAAEQSGAPSGGGGEEDASALSERQRQIIAGTFNVSRDRETYTEQGYREAVTTLELAQNRLREQVQTLVQRMRMRGVTEMDSTFARIAELLPRAAAEMEAAAEHLKRREAAQALAPEQRALQQLLRAEALYRDVQVQLGQQQSSGGGGSPAEDLADLFELEMDKIRNQYETVQRSQQEQSQREVDEAMERLRELAQRQQQEAERQRQAASQPGQAAQQGSGGSQRRLADETEEAARRLERLARENSSPQLQDAARQLREAANEMRRSAAQSGGRGLAEANAARQKIEEARRRLERNRSESVTRAAEDAEKQARELREQQRSIERDVAGLGANPSVDDVQRLNERKSALERGVGDLENRLDRAASAAAGTNRDAARELGETAAGLRDSRVRDKIRASRDALQNRSREYGRALEEQISRDLERTRARLEGIGSAAGSAQQARDRSQQTLERARALARAAEAMSERARGAASASTGAGAAAGSNELRQLQSEARERAAEIDRLRRELRGQGVDADELASAAEGMRRAQDGRYSSDPEELERLLRSVARGLENVEYDLRQRIEGREREKLFIASPGQVPPKYRRAVEEYYRSLARDRN